MPSIIRSLRFSGLAIVAAAVVACQPVRSAPEPTVTALIVRNTGAFDVNVYALPAPDAKPLWLGTVPPSATRSLPVAAQDLRPEGTLVVQTKAIGATATWTSNAIFLDASAFAVLDLATSSAGDCSGSVLRSIPVADVVASRR